MIYIVYLSLGANLGDRGKNIREAIRELALVQDTAISKISSLYETPPWGNINQPAFLNGAIKLVTKKEPLEFLNACQQIEKKLGRVRHEHWGARTIDIDIVHIEGVTLNTAELTIPHPYFAKRYFVLCPLLEIAPYLVINDKKIAEYISLLIDTEKNAVLTKEISSPYFLSMIAAADENGGIGLNGTIPWHYPEDMARFKNITTNNIVIMGRKTFESLPNKKPLSDRINIVMSKTLKKSEGITVARNIDELITELKNLADSKKKMFCIGGGEIYKLLLPFCKEILLTRVPDKVKTDTFFPGLAGFYLAEKENYKELIFEKYLRNGFMEEIR